MNYTTIIKKKHIRLNDHTKTTKVDERKKFISFAFFFVSSYIWEDNPNLFTSWYEEEEEEELIPKNTSWWIIKENGNNLKKSNRKSKLLTKWINPIKMVLISGCYSFEFNSMLLHGFDFLFGAGIRILFGCLNDLYEWI